MRTHIPFYSLLILSKISEKFVKRFQSYSQKLRKRKCQEEAKCVWNEQTVNLYFGGHKLPGTQATQANPEVEGE